MEAEAGKQECAISSASSETATYVGIVIGKITTVYVSEKACCSTPLERHAAENVCVCVCG